VLAVGILNDVTEARAMLETVEQVFEKADSPMIMVCSSSFPPDLVIFSLGSDAVK
jgi:hypothetical protein